MEKWRKVDGFRNYEVSNLGRVRSLTHSVKYNHWADGSTCSRTYTGQILKTPPNINKKSGYPRLSQVTLRREGKSYQKKVHRLVLEAFVGKCPEGMEGCHNDGNPLNNHLSNLRWDTLSNNQLDRKKHGTASGFKKGLNTMAGKVNQGTQIHTNKLSEKQVLDIYNLSIQGVHHSILADKYSVSKSTILAIKHKRNWKYLLAQL